MRFTLAPQTGFGHGTWMGDMDDIYATSSLTVLYKYP